MSAVDPKVRSSDSRCPDALRTTAAVYAAYAGLLGMEHGYFETLQGNHATPGLRILASYPSELPFPFGHEPAMTVIPNFLATGVAAMLVGMLILIWSVASLRRTRSPVVLLLLSTFLLFVGGGFGPISLLIIACIAALRANKPAASVTPRGPSRLRGAAANTWPWFLLASLAWVPLEFLAGQIFRLTNDHRQVLTNRNLLLSYPMLALFVLTLVAAFAWQREGFEKSLISEL